ncbi:MurR/RpiR family transcriptional regulator [uncultured Aliiroseovarius sp.]|uniref:MurR/RpiR family transcriptional regulator n=1 Tax=uncultured Aliiroseovarius sp. TaxID=1658783 RepID=UPI002594A31B|nr:MurR/RpiR family transcriptional regulator [uncultured Aliiroseovarius sp.]
MAKNKAEQPIKAKVRGSDNAPASLEEIRSLLIDITRGDTDVALGTKARNVLGQILDLQGSPDLLSITTLAKRVGTNPSTITRLARGLGFQNFGAFQKALFTTSTAQPGAFYLKQAQTALDSGDQTTKQRAAQLCHENQANIDRFVETFDPESFNRAATMIAKAGRVTVFGIRQFQSLAVFLAYGLRLIRSDVSVLNAVGLGIAEELAAMRHGDVCIVASVAPYSKQVVNVAQIAAEQGLTVIAITDRASSPLVAHSTAAIFVSHQSSFISNSITSFFAAAECLINAVAATVPKETKLALMKRQKLIERLNIEDGDGGKTG